MTKLHISQAVAQPARHMKRAPRSLSLVPYLYVLPAFLLLGIFEIWPIVFGFWISLWRWGVTAEHFVGLENYARVLRETATVGSNGVVVGEMGRSLVATFYYVLGTVPLTLLLAFLVAQLLMQQIRYRALYRTLFFLPYVTSVVAAALVFSWIFNSQVGIANEVMEWLGLPRQTWLRDPEPLLWKLGKATNLSFLTGLPDYLAGPSLVMACIILFSVWSSVGFSIVIFMAGLGNISTQLYDAAKIDGANRWQTMCSITWPLLSPTTFFLLIVSIVNAFQSFAPVYVLSGGGGYGGGAGGPLDTTLVITVYIVRNFYERPSAVGYAAAVSFVLFFILLMLTLIQFRFVGRRVHYT